MERDFVTRLVNPHLIPCGGDYCFIVSFVVYIQISDNVKSGVVSTPSMKIFTL